MRVTSGNVSAGIETETEVVPGGERNVCKEMSPSYRTSPAFTLEEHATIQHWSAQMRPRGLRTEVNWRHEFLEEALQITPRFEHEMRWLVFRAADGGYGVMLWPGLATIVPTLEAALDMVAAELDKADRKRG